MIDRLVVRPFTEDDRASVVDLWRLVFPDDPPRNDPDTVVDRKLRVQPELFLVGEVERGVVATALAGCDGVRGWVHHLAVHPDWRRRGFARKLMAEAEARLSAMGCPKLNLQVRGSNAAVVAFYERVGYAVEDRVSLAKVLTPRRDG